MYKGVFILGLTGSIGMGKSTTSKFFREAGVRVWDADATVHDLYKNDMELASSVAQIAPEAIETGQIDRTILRHSIKDNPDLLGQIEALVHPLVAANRSHFLESAVKSDQTLVVIDHPLLFETGEHLRCDAVLVVTADTETQKSRVLSRDGMTKETFEMLLAKQIPDKDKRRAADYILETTTLEAAKLFVSELIRDISTSGTEHA